MRLYECAQLHCFGIAPFQVGRGGTQRVDRVAELAETAIAVEAEDSAHLARLVLVVDVLRVLSPADRADTTLLLHELVELASTDAVAMHQVIMTAATV